MFFSGQKRHEIFSNLLDKMKLLFEVNEIKCSDNVIDQPII
jgi:hypothetical protein